MSLNDVPESAAPQKPPADKTVTTIQKRSRVESIVVTILALLTFVGFGYIAVMSFFETSVFEKSNIAMEVIQYAKDNLLLNLFFTVLFFVLLFRLRRHYDFFAKINLRVMEVALVVWVLLLGLFWVISVTSVPAADSGMIYHTATQAAQGNYASMLNNDPTSPMADYYYNHSYYNYFPYQLSFVAFSELFYRIFGTGSSMPIQIFNVLTLSSAYYAVAKIAYLLFNRRSVEFITIIMLAGCLQPILFCTYVYGNIIGMSAALWACLFLLKYFRSRRYVWLIPSALMLTLSVFVKYNNLIYLAAFVILLIVHAIREKKWQSIAFGVAVCILCVLVPSIPARVYEAKAQTQFEKGVPQICFLDMGLQDSSMASGWYSKTAVDDYYYAGFDADTAAGIAKQNIGVRMSYLNSQPDMLLGFFNAKLLSQWNEPTYESIWISQVKEHEHPVSDFVNNVYTGGTGQFLEVYFNFQMQCLLLLFVVGIYLLFFTKKLSLETMLLPLVLLGALGYHLLFEAKSQYALTYIPLMIPTAAFALNTILCGKYPHIKEIVGKINAKVEQKN